jgi:uncharacterized protein with FMN-binding domain
MKISTRHALYLFSSAAFAGLFSSSAMAVLPSLVPTVPAADATVQLAAATIKQDGSFTGASYDAYYGRVQVVAIVQGGRLVSVKVLQFPNHSGTSRSINRKALPYLLQEAVAAQSAHVNIISGATLTSRAYARSLRDALVLAGK